MYTTLLTRPWAAIATTVATVATALLLAGCGKPADPPVVQSPPVAVTLIASRAATVAVVDAYVGRNAAYRSVEIRARADAQTNLGYTHVLATESGKIGATLVPKGRLVGKGEATHMTTIDRLDRLDQVCVNVTMADRLTQISSGSHAAVTDLYRALGGGWTPS